jgi:Protein of unknown function (DUF1549)/Protein of unknown function (DUF1553)/Planctomycete cytochrome C
MSSSPCEWLWNGDEDVATPFRVGEVSRCAIPLPALPPTIRLPRLVRMNRVHAKPGSSGSRSASPIRATGTARATRLAWGLLLLVGLGSHPSVVRAEEPPTPAQMDFFEKRIRPFLANDCYECHGAEKQKGGLRLDSRTALRKGGDSGPAIVPGDAARSLLIQSIRHEHADTRMPKDRPKLSESAIGSFVQWVNEGAPDPRDHPPVTGRAGAGAADWASVFEARREWWSFQPLKKPMLPAVKDTGWSSQPIDRFILAALEAGGIQPAAPASPTTWLRRVHFVITGLPPTPDELQTFLQDPSPAGRTRVVDRLLASPHYGERWARHWMDLVRFAETYGHEQDFDIPHAWRYRDYLIRAFNADVPYDLFVKEHVAGDLLQPARLHPGAGFNESVIGTGWWYMHQATHAPVDPALDEADRIDNQIDVFSKTFLGLTVACARCHDHKFDAISTRDYYSLTAYLRGSRQEIASLDPDGTLEPRVDELRRLHGREIGNLREALKRAHTADGRGIATYLSAAREVLHGPAKAGDGEGIAVNDSPAAGKPRYARPIAVVARERGLTSAILESWMNELTSDRVRKPSHPLRSWREAVERENLAATNTVLEVSAPEKATPASIDTAFVPFPAPDFRTWFPSGQAFGRTSETLGDWRVEGSGIELLPPGIAHSGRMANPLQGTLRSPSFTITHTNIHLRVAGRSGQVRLIIARYGLREFNPLLFEQTLFDLNTDGEFVWHSITAGLHRHIGRPAYLELVDRGEGFVALDRIVFSTGAKPPADSPWIPTAASSREIATAIEAAFHQELDAWINPGPEAKSLAFLSWLTKKRLVDWGDSSTAIAGIASRNTKASEGLPPPLRVLAMTDGTAEPTRVFIRGDPRTPGTPVSRRVPEAMACTSAASVVDSTGRMELAESLLAECNPLTYRVIVNRVWAHVFGRGLVPTVDNLGAMGQKPSHPELLDHLALGFRSDGGSIKRLIRTLCLTQTFQMSGVSEDPVAKTRDPENALLHRMPLRRLEGEAIRDSLLAVAGQLNQSQFGPSVPTYFTPFMGDRVWVKNASGPLDGDRRRSIYLETRRNFLSTWMLTFDLPLPDTTVGLRNRSNVPGQALALMNDPLVQQLANAWARKSLQQSGLTERERITQLFLSALTRPPKEAEIERMLTFIEAQASARQLSGDARQLDPELWADVCHVVFMMKEFIHVP